MWFDKMPYLALIGIVILTEKKTYLVSGVINQAHRQRIISDHFKAHDPWNTSSYRNEIDARTVGWPATIMPTVLQPNIPMDRRKHNFIPFNNRVSNCGSELPMHSK